MDDTMRRCILAMLLLTSGLPLMFAGPLLAAQPAAGALLEHQISGSCLQVQRGMRSAA